MTSPQPTSAELAALAAFDTPTICNALEVVLPDSRARGLNDDGAVAFHLTFTDGREGVFIAAVPEPGTAAMLALGLAAMARRRRLS